MAHMSRQKTESVTAYIEQQRALQKGIGIGPPLALVLDEDLDAIAVQASCGAEGVVKTAGNGHVHPYVRYRSAMFGGMSIHLMFL